MENEQQILDKKIKNIIMNVKQLKDHNYFIQHIEYLKELYISSNEVYRQLLNISSKKTEKLVDEFSTLQAELNFAIDWQEWGNKVTLVMKQEIQKSAQNISDIMINNQSNKIIICKRCQFINSSKQITCIACTTLLTVPTIPTIQTNVKDCKRCTFQNKKENKKCEVCDYIL